MQVHDKLKIITTGNASYLELCGKTIGTGVSSFHLGHEGGKNAVLNLSLDLDSFEFMPDGYFNEVEKTLERKPSEDCDTEKETFENPLTDSDNGQIDFSEYERRLESIKNDWAEIRKTSKQSRILSIIAIMLALSRFVFLIIRSITQ